MSPFIGFNASCSHETRKKAIREFLGKHSADSAQKVEHVRSCSKGPQGNRTACLTATLVQTSTGNSTPYTHQQILNLQIHQ
jgi:hypothetical protein